MGNVLGIIGTFLENYQRFFENLRIAKKISIIYLSLIMTVKVRNPKTLSVLTFLASCNVCIT